MPLDAKNSREVRVTQLGEECVKRVQHGGSGITNFCTNIFQLLSAEQKEAQNTLVRLN